MDATLIKVEEQDQRAEATLTLPEPIELTTVELAYVGGGMANFSFA